MGCGLIGRKRAKALTGATVSVCCDLNLKLAQQLAAEHGARSTADWRDAVSSPDVDVVFVATTHDVLPCIAEEAASRGKHVLIEKPGGRNAAALEPVKTAAAPHGMRLCVWASITGTTARFRRRARFLTAERWAR